MPDDEDIRRRAHDIWLREGQPEGRHAEHWAQACQELEVEGAGAPPGEAAPDPNRNKPPPDAGAAEVARIID